METTVKHDLYVSDIISTMYLNVTYDLICYYFVLLETFISQL